MDRTLNCAEVMRLLRISRSTVRDMLACRELQGFARGKVIRIDARSVDRLLGREGADTLQAPLSGQEGAQ